MKITLDLDADLYRAVKVEAARNDRSVRDVIAEALEHWLEQAEDAEDRAAAEFFRHVAAETQATYGSDVE